MRFSRAERTILSDWWFSIDRQLLAGVLLLIILGLVLSLAASPAIAIKKGHPPFYFVERHSVFAALGLIVMLLMSLARPVTVRRLALLLFLGSLALMVLALIDGPTVNGARRWVAFAGQRLQPSELIKPALVILSAWLFARAQQHGQGYFALIALAMLVLVAGLLVLQPDVGQTMLLIAVWGAMFVVAGQPLVWIIGLGVAGAGFLAGAYMLLPHVASRIDRFVNPDSGDTYQADRALESFVGGGWFGRGPGEGTIKISLPDAHTDYIFAVIGEEYGLLACLLLLALFGFVAARGITHLKNETDLFIRNATAGLVLLLSVQAMINMGVNTGLLPAKGMTLPFISYGGSSMLGMAIGMGALLALTRRDANQQRYPGASFTPRSDPSRNNAMRGTAGYSQNGDSQTGHSQPGR